VVHDGRDCGCHCAAFYGKFGAEGGTQTHGAVTRTRFSRQRSKERLFSKAVKCQSRRSATVTQPRESHDQGASNAGCGGRI
jgi:hypothetical protein